MLSHLALCLFATYTPHCNKCISLLFYSQSLYSSEVLTKFCLLYVADRSLVCRHPLLNNAFMTETILKLHAHSNILGFVADICVCSIILSQKSSPTLVPAAPAQRNSVRHSVSPHNYPTRADLTCIVCLFTLDPYLYTLWYESSLPL